MFEVMIWLINQPKVGIKMPFMAVEMLGLRAPAKVAQA
jgi:hypothetical protein